LVSPSLLAIILINYFCGGRKMASGYMGKILFVDLSTGEIKEEPTDEKWPKNTWAATASAPGFYTAG